MNATHPSSSSAQSLDRRIRMLHTAMGPLIAAALADPDVVEVMLNPDGSLWVDCLSTGRAPTGETLSAADGERIIRLVAAHVGVEVHRDRPLLSAELPETGERFGAERQRSLRGHGLASGLVWPPGLPSWRCSTCPRR